MGCLAAIIVPIVVCLILIVVAIFTSTPSPDVHLTTAGFKVINRSNSDAIVNVTVRLHAASIGRPSSPGDFFAHIARVGPRNTVFVALSQFKAKSGHTLNMSKFEVNEYSVSYHDPGDPNGTASQIGGTISVGN